MNLWPLGKLDNEKNFFGLDKNIIFEGKLLIHKSGHLVTNWFAGKRESHQHQRAAWCVRSKIWDIEVNNVFFDFMHNL